MEKNTFTGLFIIALILIGWSFFMKPTQPEINQYKKQSDSIELAKKGIIAPTAVDSSKKIGAVDTSVSQKQEFITLENELMKVTLTTKGGRVYSTELKGQRTAEGQPLILFNGDDNRFGFKIPLTGRNLITNDEFFKPLGSSLKVAGHDSSSVTLRLPVSASQYIDYVYSLKGDSYLLGYNVKMVGMNQLIAPNTKSLDIEWSSTLLKQEKDLKAERQYSTVYYKPVNEKADYLSESKDEEEKPETTMKWIAFKQHFFSSVLIADNQISQATLNTETDLSKSSVKKMLAQISVPYVPKSEEVYGMKFYFGPNHFTTLKKTGYDLQQLVNLGWGPLGWINRWAVIPVFNFLSGFNMNYGIIILLLTVILKLVLLPLTYSSYKSQAKMRILKPEMDAIKAKVGEEDQTRLQQEYMKLYKQAGVNPLAGCVPLLLQMPILFAFFKFFPSAFELRQQSFLWVKDLSTFDSIISWSGNIPLISSTIGNHISLMCILMTISTLIYTWMNNKISGVTGQMKWLGYIMPVMFMGVLNSFPAGLNYYYFCANMITFGQQYLIKMFVNEDAIHAQLEQNKKRPEANKKSKWQMRLEEMTKQQQQRAVEQKKK